MSGDIRFRVVVALLDKVAFEVEQAVLGLEDIKQLVEALEDTYTGESNDKA